MEDFDLSKSFDDLLKPKEAALSTTTEVPDITSLELSKRALERLQQYRHCVIVLARQSAAKAI